MSGPYRTPPPTPAHFCPRCDDYGCPNDPVTGHLYSRLYPGRYWGICDACGRPGSQMVAVEHIAGVEDRQLCTRCSGSTALREQAYEHRRLMRCAEGSRLLFALGLAAVTSAATWAVCR